MTAALLRAAADRLDELATDAPRCIPCAAPEALALARLIVPDQASP